MTSGGRRLAGTDGARKYLSTNSSNSGHLTSQYQASQSLHSLSCHRSTATRAISIARQLILHRLSRGTPKATILAVGAVLATH